MSFHQSLDNFIFRAKLILQEIYVVLKNSIRPIFKVWNSLIKDFHKTINFFMQSGGFALYIALQSREFCLIFPNAISGCRIIGFVGNYITCVMNCKSLVHCGTSFINILSTIWRRILAVYEIFGVGVNFKPLKTILVWHLDSVIFDKLKSLSYINLLSLVPWFLMLVFVGCLSSTFCVFFFFFICFIIFLKNFWSLFFKIWLCFHLSLMRRDFR